MFGARATDYSDTIPDMNYIKEFHNLPYYTSTELSSIYSQIKDDITDYNNTSSVYYSGLSNLSSDSLEVYSDVNTSSDSDLDKYSIPIPMKSGGRTALIQTTQENTITEIVKYSPIKNVEKTICNNCACTNTLIIDNIRGEKISEETEDSAEYAEVIDWLEFIDKDKEEFDVDIFWNNYSKTKTSNSCNSYNDKLVLIRAENNTMKRSSLFVSAYINKLGRIPSVDEAELEYIVQGLNRNSQSSTVNRRNRLKGCIEYYFREYDESYSGFKLNWTEEKARVINTLYLHLPEKLTFKQGKQTKNIIPEEIGFIYHVICKMDNSDQNFVLSNSLSYKQADELFLNQYGKKCGRHKFSAILKILLSYKLIKKKANYKVGLRGNCYEPILNTESTQYDPD